MKNKDFNIEKIFSDILKYIKENNPSSDAPYHNNSHMITVYKFCKDIANDIGYTDTVNLLVAALLHDFDHSMGKEKDNINVQRAIKGFSDYYDNNLINSIVDKDEVVSIIRITEYPYTIESSELNIPQKIIRDADLLQGAVDNWYDYIIVGLSKEMNLPIDLIKEGTLDFRSKIRYNFDYSKEIFLSNNDEITNRLLK
jgi:HD superfamily phosphodiesterase